MPADALYYQLMFTHKFYCVPFLLASFLLAAPLSSTVSAQTLAAAAPCFVVPATDEQADVTLTATGLTPGDDVDAMSGPVSTLDGSLEQGFFYFFRETTVAPSGNAVFVSSVNTGTPFPWVGSATVTVDDTSSDIADIVSTPIDVTQLALEIGNENVFAPTKTTTWMASGLIGENVYAHLMQPRTHRVFTVKIGATTGPCGFIETKAKGFPLNKSQFRTGTWLYQLDGSAKYSTATNPKVISSYHFYNL